MKTDSEKNKNVVKWLDGPESKGFEEGRARLRERYRLNKSKLTATEWNAVMLEIDNWLDFHLATLDKIKRKLKYG